MALLVFLKLNAEPKYKEKLRISCKIRGRGWTQK